MSSKNRKFEKHSCGPTTHRSAFSDSASRTLCRLGPTAHRVVLRWRRMLLAALGLPCFRAPPAEGVGEPTLEAPRNSRQIAGRNAYSEGRPRARLSTPRRCPRRAEGGQNRHQPAQEVAVQPDIPGADAVADERRSQLRDALSVGTIPTPDGPPPMLKIPLVVWIANAAVRWTGAYGDITHQAQQAACSRQTVYDHAQKVHAAVEVEYAGGPT